MVRKTLWIGTVASGLALMFASPGLAKGLSLVRVSSPPSPYAAACAQSDTSQAPPGRMYVNGTEEPQVAVSGSNMIAMWHQDRWSNGGAHGIGVGYSTNGGKSWTETTIPWSICSGATQASGLNIYLRNSDPWMSFGPDGKAYASALAFNLGFPNWDNAIAVATSSDFGKTWNNVGPVPGSSSITFSNSTDKNSTTADPTTAGTAYTVWDTLIEPTDNPDDNPRTCAYTGPAFFSKTIDGGASWSKAEVMVNTANRQQTIGNIIVVDPTTTPHTLYDFFDNITTPNTCIQGTRSTESVAVVTSTDDGTTWSQPQTIAPFNSLGVVDPNTGARLRVGDGLQEVARDSVTGDMYLVWESSTNYAKNVNQSSSAFDNEVLFSRLRHGSTMWSAPASIDIGSNGMPAFTPTVAAYNGRVAVTYYDSRFLQVGQTTVMPTDYWARVSNDGGATFGSEQRLTASSFDVMSAPVARGFFLGDYEGLQPSGSGFEAVFVKTNCDAPYTGTDCGPANYTTRVPQTSNTDPTDVFSIAIS